MKRTNGGFQVLGLFYLVSAGWMVLQHRWVEAGVLLVGGMLLCWVGSMDWSDSF